VQKAQSKRLNLIAPTSTVQMEYICHMKSKVMLEKIAECVKLAVSLGAEVEFTAEDATRSDKDFLSAAITTAVECGATVVTLCDATGEMLPEEVFDFVTELKAACPALGGVQLSFECKDSLGLASGVCLAAAKAGAAQIKVASCGITGYTSLEKFMHILQVGKHFQFIKLVKPKILQAHAITLTYSRSNSTNRSPSGYTCTSCT
jgi:2-isopropylmalate synthase